MKTSLSRFALFLLGISLLCLCSCGEEKLSTYMRVLSAREKFSSSLSNVMVYSSLIEEGNEGYIDRELITAMLGDDGVFPKEMELCEQYSFFCASGLEICEGWIVKCRTYTAARDIEALFERRRLYLSKQDFDLDKDIAAVTSACVMREGKYVYFAATQNSDAVLEYMKKE